KFCYLVVLNEKFLTLLASYLLLQIEQVLSEIGITFMTTGKTNETFFNLPIDCKCPFNCRSIGV
ncbi:hypothetical protein C3B51_20770, partial [Pseudoalteromonas rubra]